LKIRTQLVLLVLATIAPIAILAVATTARLFELQRESYEQRFLERVNTLRLALDTEIEGTIRTLRSLADASDFEPGEPPNAARAHFVRLLHAAPHWATMGWLAASGATIVRVDQPGIPAEAVLDADTVARVRASGQPVVSNLVAPDGGRVILTYIAVPMHRARHPHDILYVGVEHAGWLEFLRRYPIAENATLTLNDRDGYIIARTLNDERWVGKRSSPDYWDRTQGQAQGVFRNTGLEGQRFYSAFSRLANSGWVLGTGVPEENVDASFAWPASLLAAGVLAAGLAAWLLAWIMGRRVTTTVAELEEAARSMATAKRIAATRPLPIAEAETVRRALDEASEMLTARARSLSDALDREARSRADAEHANRAKDQFLAMLGHELRNPISAISAAAVVLDRAGGDPEVARRARDIVGRQLRHLTEIVNDLLDVARLTSGKVALNAKPLDLAEATRAVIASFRAAGRCTHVAVDCDLEPAIVLGDETRIEQIIANLLDNACKYTPGGGHVSASVSAAGGHAELAIRDDGAGIAPEVLPHVFDAFAQGERSADRSLGGLGLGLTVVRRLVELHGGTVSAASDGSGCGSTFTVRLPLADAASRDAPALHEPALSPPLRIVLVEDNADSRDVVAALLRMQGHEVHAAADGPAGVAAILGRPCDVALVDIGLPVFDGAELARRVRADIDGEDVILVALSGYGSAEDRAQALRAGFDAYLVKPFDAKAFEHTVTAARLQRAQTN